jgi:hypothetical protein
MTAEDAAINKKLKCKCGGSHSHGQWVYLRHEEDGLVRTTKETNKTMKQTIAARALAAMLCATLFTTLATGQTAEYTFAQTVVEGFRAKVGNLQSQIEQDGKINDQVCVKKTVSRKHPPIVDESTLSDNMRSVLAKKDYKLPFKGVVCDEIRHAWQDDKKLLSIMNGRLIDANSRLQYVDKCLAVYHKTIDERAADITTREAELIKECKSFDMYPPKK